VYRETHISFECVEEHEILIGKASDERAANAVLLWGEFASEQRLAPLARQDSGVICVLNGISHELRFPGARRHHPHRNVEL